MLAADIHYCHSLLSLGFEPILTQATAQAYMSARLDCRCEKKIPKEAEQSLAIRI
jgi:hypothetical protein